MLPQTENKKPGKHNGKLRGKRTDKNKAKTLKQEGQNRQAPAAHKKQEDGNEYHQKAGQLPGQFQKRPLQAADSKSVVQEIVKDGIENRLAKTNKRNRPQKKANVRRNPQNPLFQPSKHLENEILRRNGSE